MSVTRGFLVSLLLCLLGAAVALAQPVGPEFRVNTYTTSYQAIPSVASDASGNFVVVWTSVTRTARPRRLRPALRQHRRPARPRVPRQHLHDDLPALPVRRRRLRPATSSSSGTATPGRLGLRRLRPALRQLRRAPRSRVPRQHLHDGLPDRSVRRRRRLRQLRRRLGELRPGRLGPAASSASATPAPARPSAPSSASTPTRRAFRAFRPSPPTPPATSSSSGTSDDQDGSG